MTVHRPGIVEETIGGPPVVLTIAGVEVDSNDVGPVAIRRGRPSGNDRFPPATATLVFRRSGLADLPTLGDTVNVELTPDALDYFGADADATPRFVGRVSDARARPESKLTGPALVTVVAVGDKSRLGQALVGGVLWPQEDDGERADRIFAEIVEEHPEITIGISDPGGIDLIGKYAETAVAFDAETAFTQLTDDTGGECVELRDGSLAWWDFNHRRGAPTVVELAAGNVAVPLEFAQQLAGTVNDLTIAWGYTIEDLPRFEVRSVDPGPGAPFSSTGGRISARQESEIFSWYSAQVRALEVVGRRGRPRWRIAQGLLLDLFRTLTLDQAAAVLAADVGFLARVTGFPASGPFVTALLWAEGWTERITRDRWTLELDLVEYPEVGPSARWADMPLLPTPLTWDDVDPALTWFDYVGLFSDPGVSYRWLDQPSDLKWATLDPGLTWATY